MTAEKFTVPESFDAKKFFDASLGVMTGTGDYEVVNQGLVVGRDICSGQRQAEGGTVGGFVFGLDDLQRRAPVGDAEALSLPRLGVETVKHGAAFGEPVSFFHGCLSG